MPQARDRKKQNELKEMIREVQDNDQDIGGFLKSYKDFVDKWGSYKKTQMPGGKSTGRPRHAMFKAPSMQNE